MRFKTREDYVEEFHEAMGQPIDVEMNDDRLARLRLNLLYEEWMELDMELDSAICELLEEGVVSVETKKRLLKEMADLQYVLSGLAVTFGLPLQEAFVRVHKSNMSKLDDDGKPVHRDDGKVMKSSNYKPADLSDLVE